MEIQGPNFGRYDSGYLTAVQREVARSVKPNVLRDLDDDVAKALLLSTTDAVNLSPEAKAYLKRLREKMRGRNKSQAFEEPEKEDFEALLAGLGDLRSQVQEDAEKEAEASKSKGQKQSLFPPTITLSSHNPAAPRPKGSGYSPVRDTIDRMIYYAPGQRHRQILQSELEVMGFEIVSQVKSFGTRIIVLGAKTSLSQLRIKGMAIVAPGERTFDGRPWDSVRGLYDNSRRILVIGEEQIGRSEHCVARHEFAHAFDHAFSERNHRRLPLSVQLWNLFMAQRAGLVSKYASTNPAEYFAESVEAFFQPAGRRYLQDNDPKMHSYLSELFQVVTS